MAEIVGRCTGSAISLVAERWQSGRSGVERVAAVPREKRGSRLFGAQKKERTLPRQTNIGPADLVSDPTPRYTRDCDSRSNIGSNFVRYRGVAAQEGEPGHGPIAGAALAAGAAPEGLAPPQGRALPGERMPVAGGRRAR